MTKAGFWRKDWFLGLVVSLVLLAAGGTLLIEALERFAYDWGVRASARIPSDKISVIAIDKRSIDNIGRWPWSREIHAKMIERLADAKAKVIGYTVFFSEPQLDPGLACVNRLLAATPRRFARAGSNRRDAAGSRECAQHRQEARRELRQGGQRGAAAAVHLGRAARQAGQASS